jgi:protein-S-isoprenylcysteine O-methyltransferase Ste14
MLALRQLISIVVLPGTVLVLVPRWLLGSEKSQGWPPLPRGAAGIAVFLLGFVFFAWSVSLFTKVGLGTLAPWDPTRRLVAVGPYRRVRNPMISGVVLMLFGEALFFGSRSVALWGATFLLANHVYFVLLEEPGLEARFGEEYRAYKAHVPRWIPRLRPWTGGQPGGGLEGGRAWE